MEDLKIREPIEIGPFLEETTISAGLDYYKPTMSQLAYDIEPNTEVSFTFKNRGHQRLADHVSPEILSDRLEDIRQKGWSQQELDYLAGIINSNGDPVFSINYLDYLKTTELPEVEVKLDSKTDDLAIEVIGKWAVTTFWETIVMSQLNEVYFEHYLAENDLDPNEVYDEGDRRLSDKIKILQANPEIKFADFGTRRHFSARWHKHVIDRLVGECPDNIVGTSNVAYADSFGIKPIGTYAHEMPMIYAGLADVRNQDIRDSHHRFMNDWFNHYGEDYSIALTDTFTTDFFFTDFTPKQAELWRGVRQDSGDPFEFARTLIDFYKTNNIDPKTRTVVFSDGLDIENIVELQKTFQGQINILFGWGTTLTNDLGIKSLNIVMKATRVRDIVSNKSAMTVKLSDDNGKHTGPSELVDKYQNEYFVVSHGDSSGI